MSSMLRTKAPTRFAMAAGMALCSALAWPGTASGSVAGWTTTGSLATGRGSHRATLLPDGRVLVAGGYDFATATYTATAELYDPASGTWTPTGSMAVGREHLSATLLEDGRVLVAGGYDGHHRLASVEVYQPSSGTWSPTARMGKARSRHTATLL